MKRPALSLATLAALAFLSGRAPALAQVGATTAPPVNAGAGSSRPDQVVLSAIRSHPVTAPYPIAATWQKGKVILTGRVGTSQVHDTAVRLAIDLGYPFRDDLVIDTGTAHMVAQSAAAAMAAGSGRVPGSQTASPYVYPPPLFGRLDDPFFGYVPPLVSFPPWWSRSSQTGAMVQPRRAPDQPAPPRAVPAGPSEPGNTPIGGWRPLEVDPIKGQVEISVDIAGQVFLRGTVVSEQAAREIEESARSVPGVTNVINNLEIIPRRDPAADAPPPPPVPIPPPQDIPAPGPAIIVPGPQAPAGAAPAAAALDSQALSRRVLASLAKRPVAAALPVKVRSSDGVVTLSGKVPTTYEAMLVYRAAQQTPGVREIIDRLEFTVPDEDHPNPLLNRGRPEDIEPYLASQIRRHVGDLAHIDRISAHGNVLELHGTIQNAGDQERLMAILRSISVLHGFKLEPEFKAE